MLKIVTLFSVVLGTSALAAPSVSLEPSAAFALSAPQASYFGVGGGGLLGVHFELASVLDLQAQVGGFVFSPRANAPVDGAASVLLAGGGLRLHFPYASRFVPWLDAGLHYVNTGGLSRLNLTAGVGLLFGLTADGSFFIGPHARLLQIFKLFEELGFRDYDSTSLAVGLTVLVRFPDPARPLDPARAPVSEDGDGDGVPDVKDGCPTQAGLVAFAGCPDPDPDRDGVLSPADQCPEAAEDRDGFQDADGCPDPDNDHDSVLDGVDDCPLVAGAVAGRGCPDGDSDGVADQLDECPRSAGPAQNRGCPVYRQVVVTEARIEINQKIFFAFGKAEILPKSFGLMNEVARALVDHSKLCVRIEGHTDAVGGAQKNLKLSDERAGSVKDYLLARGVEQGRLASQGYGPNQPLESNASPEGRERNRRVEFVLVDCPEPR